MQTPAQRPKRKLLSIMNRLHGWRRLESAIVLCAVIATGCVQPASAMSAAQWQLMQAGITNFNIQDDQVCGSQSGGNITIAGSTNAEKAYNFFVGVGLTPFQAAGIMGNMQAESGIQPQRLQGTASGVVTPAATAVNDGGGWGLVQWTPGSKFINTQNPISNADDIGTQLTFLWSELTGQGPLPEKQAGDDVKSTTSVEDAVLAFQGNRNVGGQYVGFERPANESASVPFRTSAARQFLTMYGGNTTVLGSIPQATYTPNTGCSGPVAAGGTTIPTGDTMTLAKQLIANSNVTFQTKQDSDYFDEVLATGKQTDCGGPTISPTLLGVILKLSQSYKIVLGVFDDGHGCDGGFHPKGAAVDINGVNPIDGGAGGTGTHITYAANELPILRQFYTSAGQILAANGGGGLGQQQCFPGGAPKVSSPPNVYFDDTCNHLHMDTRGK